MIAPGPTAIWFETRGGAALLTMRTGALSMLIKDLGLRGTPDLILRSIAKRCVSKDEATALEEQDAFRLKPNGGRLLPPRPACGERAGVRGSLSEYDSRRVPLTRRYAPTSPRKRGEVYPTRSKAPAWQR
jgi:hypothetical protein